MTWVRLNVGGQTFEASLETLIKFPMSELAKMFQSESDEDQNLMTTGEKVNTNNNVYNLDLDPQAFSVVLSWLRYEDKHLPLYLCCQVRSLVSACRPHHSSGQSHGGEARP